MNGIAVTPVGKPRMTQRDVWKQRPAVMRYRQFCDDLRAALPGYVLPGVLKLTFYLPMPPSWSADKRRSHIGAPHEQKPDIDNLCKAFMDAFGPDAHVHELHATKYWSETGAIDLETSE